MTTTLTVSRWGNSLAMRLPSDFVRRLGLHEGDSVKAQMTTTGTLLIEPPGWNRREFAAELAQARDQLPLTEPVIETMRNEARY